MSRPGSMVVLLLLAATMTAPPSARAQQEVVLAGRRPHFVAAWAPDKVELDMSGAAVLRGRIPLDLSGVSVGAALDEISRHAGLQISYSAALLPKQKTVTIHAQEIGVAAALTDVLFETGLDVAVGRNGRLAVIESQQLTSKAAKVASGTIVGKVIDAKTQTALAGATVVVQGTSRSATSSTDGRYRIAEVAPGTYTVRARYIGYAPGTASVTVRADQEATADFTLEKSAQRLDEVVTTGTVVPTEVKALPSPVSVISESDIALQRPHTVPELFRQIIPTAVSWDYVAFPNQTSFSVRGASNLSPGSGELKVFVDGIPATSTASAPVDPNSIERVEVIRGPQAAAIYGSDAIGGVIQIFTKRGDPSLARPRVSAEAALGVIQTPYGGYGSVLRQNYAASVRGGGSDVSYNFGGGYSHTGDYIPGGEISRQSNPSLYGGMRFARGIVTADVSGLYLVQNEPQVLGNPELYSTGDLFYSKPLYRAQQEQHQSVGARLGVAPTKWWQHTLTVGLDRVSTDQVQTQPRLTTPADTLLVVQNFNQTKASIGYSTSLQGSLVGSVSGSLTAGFDHYSLPNTQWFTGGALTTTGTIRTAPGQSIGARRTITNNTGYFAQVQLGFQDALFLTGGLRAEQNTNFGDSLGTPLSPRVGLAYAQQVGGATLKLRSSWGRAIRAPSPGQKFGSVSATSVILDNPKLGPERQQGWDAGVDAVFGARGSLSVTYYDQTAENLIQFVLVSPTPPRTSQFQNVARVKNTGVEVEGALTFGLLQLRGQYGYSRARIDQLAPNYAGDLQVGDQTMVRPKHTAGASLSVVPLPRTTFAAGLTYVGSWNQYDVLAQERCFGGTGPCLPGPGSRNYIIAYPGFVKLNATVSQQITGLVSGFASFDNLTNKAAFEGGDNGLNVMGRITTVGLRLQY